MILHISHDCCTLLISNKKNMQEKLVIFFPRFEFFFTVQVRGGCANNIKLNLKKNKIKKKKKQMVCVCGGFD